MIRTLRTRLVAAAMASLGVVLTVILGLVLLSSYQNIVSDADRILNLLAENQGRFPQLPEDFDWEAEGPRRQSPELGYEIPLLFRSPRRGGGGCGDRHRPHRRGGPGRGGGLRPPGSSQRDGTGLLGGLPLSGCFGGDGHPRGLSGLRGPSAELPQHRAHCPVGAGGGMLAVFLLLLLLSRRIVRPIAESHEKQKRFLTDAGHELKTPIAIIQADTDVLTLETGEGNEWVTDIQRQVARLTDLTNELMDLARLEEPRGGGTSSPSPSPTWWRRPPSPSRPWPGARGRGWPCPSSPGSPWWGRRSAWPSWVSLLLDNAVKYAPPGDEITSPSPARGRPCASPSPTPPRPQPGGAGEYVRPLLPGGQGPQLPAGGLWHRPGGGQGGGPGPPGQDHRRRPGRPPGDDGGPAGVPRLGSPARLRTNRRNANIHLLFPGACRGGHERMMDMTAKTFYGASWQTLDRARRQVLQTVREGRGVPDGRGGALHHLPDQGPASACRKLRQRGLAPTAQAL